MVHFSVDGCTIKQFLCKKNVPHENDFILISYIFICRNIKHINSTTGFLDIFCVIHTTFFTILDNTVKISFLFLVLFLKFAKLYLYLCLIMYIHGNLKKISCLRPMYLHF